MLPFGGSLNQQEPATAGAAAGAGNGHGDGHGGNGHGGNGHGNGSGNGGNGNGHGPAPVGGYSLAPGVAAHTVTEVEVVSARLRTDSTVSKADLARLKGYTGDACGECGSFTMVRNGSCLKCDSCGQTSGCS
jgi:ribonucleoside-diphosphate reductase alpha chain